MDHGSLGMKASGAGLAAFLLVAAPAHADSVQLKSLGGLSCAEWPVSDFYTNVPKAVPLNFVLGLLAGRTSVTGRDALAGSQVTEVSAYLDQYCASHPRSDIVQGALALEAQLQPAAPKPPASAAPPAAKPGR